MSKWSVLRHLIDNGNVDMALRGLSESAFITLVEAAEKAELEECRHLNLTKSTEPNSFTVCNSCGKIVPDLLDDDLGNCELCCLHARDEIHNLESKYMLACSPPIKPHLFRPRRPKTLAEEIWAMLQGNVPAGSSVFDEWNKLAMALAEAVELLEEGRYQDTMKSILAILKGEKVRGIPK